MLLFVGLGNPGSRYAGNRHNIGFMVVEAIAKRHGITPWRRRFQGVSAEGPLGGDRVLLLLPGTYMNESGNAAGPARGSFGVPLDRVLALHDEIDLPFGEVRTKLGGGVAGHNGLKSLERGLGSRDFQRVRIGVGRPDSTDPEVVSRWVLGRFAEDRESVAALIESAAAATERLIDEISNDEDGNEE